MGPDLWLNGEIFRIFLDQMGSQKTEVLVLGLKRIHYPELSSPLISQPSNLKDTAEAPQPAWRGLDSVLRLPAS